MMRPRWDPSSPELLPAIVLYADILGFRQMTEDALKLGKETDFLLRIKRSLAKAYERVDWASKFYGDGPAVFDVKVFTDNIVVAFPLLDPNREFGELELTTLLGVVAEFQALLAVDGFLLRGAITHGQHYQDDEIVYGKALLEAVDHDKSGGPPRMVIGDSVEPLIAKHLTWRFGGPTPHHYHLLEDPCDERLFVNYLRVAFENFPDGPVDYELLHSHRQMVSKGLREYKSTPTVHEKYVWAANYHNYVCRTFAEIYQRMGKKTDDPEVFAYCEEAQQALKYLVPVKPGDTLATPRLLDGERLQVRLSTR